MSKRLYLEVIQARFDDSQLPGNWDTQCVDILSHIGEERILEALKDIPVLIAEVELLRAALNKIHNYDPEGNDPLAACAVRQWAGEALEQ